MYTNQITYTVCNRSLQGSKPVHNCTLGRTQLVYCGAMVAGTYVMDTQCRDNSRALIVVDAHCGVALQTPYRLGAREYVLAHCPESKRGGASASSCQQVWVAVGRSCSRWGGGGRSIEHQ